MNEMEITKIVAGVCGALLLLLLLKWGAETIYHVGPSGHGEAHASDVQHGYPIEVEVADEAGAVEEGPSIEELLAVADLGKGEKVYNKCKSCHELNDPTKKLSGPHLIGVIGRDIASVDGFGYSGALTDLPGEWTAAEFSAFLTDPKKYAPGTKMNVKLKKGADRANLIAYLQTFQ